MPHPSPSFVRADQGGGRWLGFAFCEGGFEVIIQTCGKLLPARTVATLLGRSGQATECQVLAGSRRSASGHAEWKADTPPVGLFGSYHP